jgi:hypothetical protein
MSFRVYNTVSLKIGVTAHRDLSHADEASLERQVRQLFSSLQQEYPDLPLTLLNPLAPGGDMLVARVALDMGITVEVPLPMPLEIYEKDYSTPELLDEFRRLCKLGTVFELPLASGTSTDDILDYGVPRNLQYARMGTYIASHSHILLALWDGQESDAVGGTASLVNFQLSGEMIGLAEERRAEHLLADRDIDIVYHIHCPRQNGVATESQGHWLSRSSSSDGVLLPERYRATFTYMQDFQRDISHHHEAIQTGRDSLLVDPQMENSPELAEINDIYSCADWLAIYYRKLVLRELALTHGLAVLMGLSFITYSEYMQFFFLLPAFLLCFFGAWLLNKVANKMQWHRKYLDYRALAEGLRVQFYWSLANVDNFQSTAIAYDNFMQKQDMELAWIRHLMRGIGGTERSGGRRIERGVDLAIKHWIGDAGGETGQLGYYKLASHNRERKLRQNVFYGEVTLWSGISIAIILLFVGQSLDDLPTNILLILMGVLPLMAGVREAYAYKRADKELTKQYQFMRKTFTRARLKLESAADKDGQKLVLHALGEACLEEHSEWILIHRERPLEHAGLQV